MTYGELPISTWFISVRDPNAGPLFKWDDCVAFDEQQKQLPVSADDEVAIIRLPFQPSSQLC